MARNVLLQVLPGDAPTSHESRVVRMATMLLDGVGAHNARLEDLSRHAAALAAGDAMPVGTVEFVREALRLAGIPEPASPGYPARLAPWYRRDIRRTAAGQVTSRCFVKPVATKLFTGFVYDPQADLASLGPEERVNYEAFGRLAPQEPVWVCEPVRFVCEHRYYVQDRQILGSARYDLHGADDAPPPLEHVVRQVIAAYDCATPHGIDVGVLDSGETVVVEVHDAWALGLYGQNTLPATAYYQFLRGYWDCLLAGPRLEVAP